MIILGKGDLTEHLGQVEWGRRGFTHFFLWDNEGKSNEIPMKL